MIHVSKYTSRIIHAKHKMFAHNARTQKKTSWHLFASSHFLRVKGIPQLFTIFNFEMMMFVLMVHMVEGLVPTILGPPEHVRIALASESTLSFSWSTQVVPVSHERKNPALDNRKV